MSTMTQTEFQLAARGASQADRILAHLRAHLGEWVPMPSLYLVSGAFAVHSRISDLRRRGHEIHQHSARAHDGTVHSSYKLVR